MRWPAGEEHWIRGTFVEVTPHTRLVIDMQATVTGGQPREFGDFQALPRRHIGWLQPLIQSEIHHAADRGGFSDGPTASSGLSEVAIVEKAN